MALPDATHKASADAVAALGVWVAVFTGAAGTTGANEATGGGYGRQATSFATGSMSGGVWVRAGTQVTVPVATGDYVEGGLFTAQTSGTFIGSAAFVGGTVSVSGVGATILVTPSVSG